jgi:hypothetical protein
MGVESRLEIQQANEYIVIFRGLEFEHNAEIEQKNHFWMGTNYVSLSRNKQGLK